MLRCDRLRRLLFNWVSEECIYVIGKHPWLLSFQGIRERLTADSARCISRMSSLRELQDLTLSKPLELLVKRPHLFAKRILMKNVGNDDCLDRLHLSDIKSEESQ